MTKYDHQGDKITSEGPDGFLVVDFSRYKDLWTGVDEDGEPTAPPRQVDWEALIHETPERPEDEPVVDVRRKKRVLEMVENLDIVEDAKAFRVLRDKPVFVAPKGYNGAQLRDLNFPPAAYTVADLWPTGANVLFAAPAKFGKSTVMMNLVRSLLTGAPFLEYFKCPKIEAGESILLIDMEMPEPRVVSEVLEQDVPDELLGALNLFPLEGLVEQFDITNPEVVEFWRVYCEEHNVKTLIIDPLAPLLGFLGLDESDNSMVTQFFEKLGSFKKKIGVRDMMVVHHCGHTADWRPRGASRFNDWAGSLWLARINGPVNDPASPREFFCRGRDVWRSLSGEGTVTTNPLNQKKLIFDSQSGSTQQTNAAIQGEIENLFYGTPKEVRWDLDMDPVTDDGSNKKVEVIATVVRRLVGNNPDVNPNKVETVMDTMLKNGISIHCHQHSPPGTGGKRPFRVYPSDRCPHCP